MSCIGVPPNGVAMMLLLMNIYLFIYIRKTRNGYECIEYYYYKDAQNDDHTRTHEAIESSR